MTPPIQYCVVGTLFLISSVVMAISSFTGQIHTKLDVLVTVFSAISFIIACDQFRRAFVTWYTTRKKTKAAVEPDVDV